MNRTISAILVFFMIFAMLVSCGGTAETTASNETTKLQEQQDSTEPETTNIRDIPDDLPNLNFEGYKFRILADAQSIKTYVPEEMDGEIVNDATYQRNSAVEERFNVSIVSVDGGEDMSKLNSFAKKTILAGSDDFDVSFEHVIYGPNSTLEGLYMNLYDLKYIDFTKPWWPDNTVDELSLNGKIFLGSGGIAATALSGSKIIVANKDELENHNLEVPYNDVLDGVWTIDRLIELSSDCYSDLNGNGERDFADFYGYTTQPHQNGFIVSCDIPVLKKTDDGGLEINAYSEKMIWLVETLYDWYYESESSFITSTDTKSDTSFLNLFAQGRSLFAFSKIDNVAQVYRYSDVNYGILPMPKYDEEQDTYRTFAHDSFLCVPVTSQDTDLTSAVVEAMSAEGYKNIIPSFYEIVLKEKLANDSETVRMLEIINDTRTISFSYIYDNWEGFGHLFSNIFSWENGKSNRDYSSYYEKRLSSATKRMDKVIAGFAD